MSWFKFIGLVPAIADLANEVYLDLKDKRVTPDETKRIGAKLVAIVASVL